MDDDAYDRTEAEDKLEVLFDDLSHLLSGATDSSISISDLEANLRASTVKLQEGKGMVKEFEKAANFQGRPPQLVADRKRELVAKLNTFVAMNREAKKNLQQKKELLESARGEAGTSGGGFWGRGAAQEPTHVNLNDADAVAGASNQQLMDAGRNMYQQDIDRLGRMERVVEDTKQVGTTTLATLQGQTQTMEGMVSDLDDIHFTLKKAQKLIRDLMKGLATDKCILSLLAVVVVLIVVALALRFSGVADSDTIRAPGTEDESPSPPPADGGGRKLLFGAGWD